MSVITMGPSATVREAFRRLDALDMRGFAQLAADDAQGIDEISRRWMRGRADLDAYMTHLAGAVKDVRSTLLDIHERIYGDVGLITCWIEQDYTFQGTPQHVSAPTTVVLRRDGTEWRILLMHMIPLPPAT